MNDSTLKMKKIKWNEIEKRKQFLNLRLILVEINFKPIPTSLDLMLFECLVVLHFKIHFRRQKIK